MILFLNIIIIIVITDTLLLPSILTFSVSF